MINFATLFNQFRNTSNSAISDLLDQPNVELTRLLDEDSFVNEYKSGNNKLVEYMKYDRLQKLVEYVTIVGPADDRKRSYKFPLTASQVLSSENNSIVEYFFPQNQLYVDQISYQEKEVEVEMDEQSLNSGDQSAKKDDKITSETTPKTIIQQNLDAEPNQSITDKNNNNDTTKQKIQNVQGKNQQIDDQQKSQKKKKQKIITKEIRKVEKINKKPVQPLTEKLFSYFQGEVNYTLVGYICKIITSLMSKKPIIVLKYLLGEKKRISILNHIESRSVGELIVKILSYQTTELVKERGQFFKEIINKLSLNNEIFVLSNLSACVTETIQKCILNLKGNNPIKQFSALYFSPQDITSVITNVMSNSQNVSVYNAPILLTYLTNIPLNAPQNSQLLQGFQKILQIFIDKACQKLVVNNKDRKTLGFGRIKILQILNFILKQNVLDARDIVSKKDGFYNILFDLCDNYDMNNVLHNEVVKIIDIALSSQSPMLKSLIEKDVLLNFLVKQFKQDLQRRNEGGKKVRKGYIGHVVLICNKIKQYSSKNQILSRFLDRNQIKTVMTQLVEKETFEANKNLAGYSVRKNLPQKILFQKEEAIAEYIKFLNNCPTTEQEVEQHAVNPDFVIQLQKQLQDNMKAIEEQQGEKMEIKDKKQNTKIEEQSHQNIQAEFSGHKYWVKHMDFDLEEVMNDLL